MDRRAAGAPRISPAAGVGNAKRSAARRSQRRAQRQRPSIGEIGPAGATPTAARRASQQNPAGLDTLQEVTQSADLGNPEDIQIVGTEASLLPTVVQDLSAPTERLDGYVGRGLKRARECLDDRGLVGDIVVARR